MIVKITLYILATMWALGALGFGVWCFYDLRYNKLELLVSVLIGVPLAAFLGFGPLVLIHSSNGPILATLLKSEWQCTASHSASSTSYVQSGKVLVPITSNYEVCDQYGRL